MRDESEPGGLGNEAGMERKKGKKKRKRKDRKMCSRTHVQPLNLYKQNFFFIFFFSSFNSLSMPFTFTHTPTPPNKLLYMMSYYTHILIVYYHIRPKINSIRIA